MELVANWGARPVFITSTFQDMQAERDWLWDFFFPAIEDRLRRRRHLEWIDFRLGAGDPHAETEAEREAQGLKVCLDEVRRSRSATATAWLPPHDRAEAAAGEAGIAGDVTGLEAFGKLVEEALWQQLEAELAAEAEPADLSWQVREARGLEAFAADRRRDFQGRTAMRRTFR